MSAPVMEVDDQWVEVDPPEGYVGRHRRPDRDEMIARIDAALERQQDALRETVILPVTEVHDDTAYIPHAGVLPPFRAWRARRAKWVQRLLRRRDPDSVLMVKQAVAAAFTAVVLLGTPLVLGAP